MIMAQVLVGGVCVSGPDSLLVDAESTTNYPLTFAPSLTGNTSGEYVLQYTYVRTHIILNSLSVY